jgi:hypothetical protein
MIARLAFTGRTRHGWGANSWRNVTTPAHHDLLAVNAMSANAKAIAYPICQTGATLGPHDHSSPTADAPPTRPQTGDFMASLL